MCFLGLGRKLGCKICGITRLHTPDLQSIRSDMTGFQTNQEESDWRVTSGLVWVQLRPMFSHLAVRVKAKLLVSQSCLEVMLLNLPGFFGCAPVIRTHVFMDPVSVGGNEDFLSLLAEGGAMDLC